jgi:hypothetical protein
MIEVDGELFGIHFAAPEVWLWDPNFVEEYGNEGQ